MANLNSIKTPWKALTAKSLFCQRLGIENIESLDDDKDERGLNELFTDSDRADVARRTELFNVVAKDFDCEVGKVGLTITHF